MPRRSERDYYDQDFVVVTDRASAHFGEIGLVEIRAGFATDIVHTGGGSAVMVPLKGIRRVIPGDKVVNP